MTTATNQAPAPLAAGDQQALATLADMLALLIRFHDRELDAEFISGLRDHGMADWLAEVLTDDAGHKAARDLAGSLPQPDDADMMEALAAEYADIYLTHGYRVAPSGSVWLTEDHLERQLPMFDVRDWYEHYDISVPNWRVRADDHIVHELQFVAFLCGHDNRVACEDAARFLDRHVLPWVPEFCRQAEAVVQAQLYSAVMGLTRAVLEQTRDQLQQITGIERDVRLAAPPKARRSYEPEEDTSYIPGLAESW